MSGIIDYVADGLDLLFVIFGCISTRSIEEYLVFIVALWIHCCKVAKVGQQLDQDVSILWDDH
jgi:hypothetical protein